MDQPTSPRPAENRLVRKPVAQQPRAQKQRMAVPRRPITVPRIEQKSYAGMIVVALLLTGVGASLWYVYGRREKEAKRVAVAVATPQPEARKAPAAVPKPAPIAVARPAPLIIEPEPVKPAEAVPSAFSQELVLDAVEGKKAEHMRRREESLKAALEGAKWKDYSDQLRRSLAVQLRRISPSPQPQEYDQLLANPLVHLALLQQAFIATLSDDARTAISADRYQPDFYLWLLSTTEALEDWLLAARSQDNLKLALGNWATLQAGDKAARDKYRSLAIACAFVFDREVRPEWNGERLELTAGSRFTYYKQHDLAGDLTTNLTQMNARDLTWVVAAPVPDAELDWARKNVRLKQRDWGRAYGMVPYDMEKAVSGKQKKPYDKYTFSEILEKGGICGDRTYFATNTARALGIPAAEINGDGPMGGHAWFRWKADNYTWKEDGRIGGYGAGKARDPQTGKSVSELEFARRSDRRANSEALIVRASRFAWLAQLHDMLGDVPRTAIALDFAVAANRGNAEFWEEKLDYWKRTRRKAPVEEWRAFLEGWKRQFSDDADLVAVARTAEEAYVFPRLDSKLALREMRSDERALGGRRIPDAPPPTAEEISTLYQRQAQVMAKQKDYNGVQTLYRRAFREHGEDPAAFKRMARDYFAFVRVDGKAKVEAARDIETSFERYLESKDTNWFVTNSQNSALEVVANCWKEAGQPERAARLAREIEKRTKKAKRTAL